MSDSGVLPTVPATNLSKTDTTPEYADAPGTLSRRRLLSSGFAAGALLTAPAILRPSEAVATPDIVAAPGRLGSALNWRDDRKVSLVHARTDETLDITFYRNSRYDEDALGRASEFLRDYHTGEVLPIDRNLLDLLHAVRGTLDVRQPMEVISGYRSPTTNRKLTRETERAATNSMHLHGKAVDVRVKDQDTRQIRRVALDFKAGGVGYYGRWGYIHLDVGPFRYWRS